MIMEKDYRKIYTELIHETHQGERNILAFKMGWAIERDGEEIPHNETLESLLSEREIFKMHEGMDSFRLHELIERNRKK